MNVQVLIGSKIYQLNLTQKYTIVVGNSGTGKTTLARLIDDGYAEVRIDRDMGHLALINNLHPEEYPSSINKGEKKFPWHNRVVFIDETCNLLFDKYFHKGLIESDCIFVIFCRSSLVGLPLGLDNLYELIKTDNVITLNHLIDVNQINKEALAHSFRECWVEDSKSFFDYLNKHFTNVHSLKSKDSKLNTAPNVLHIVDSLGFGARYLRLVQLGSFNNYRIYFIPSYEYCIVCTEWFKSIIHWDPPLENCPNIEEYYSKLLYATLGSRLGLPQTHKQSIPCLDCKNHRKGQYCAHSHQVCDYPACNVDFFPKDLMDALKKNLEIKYSIDEGNCALPIELKLNRFGG